VKYWLPKKSKSSRRVLGYGAGCYPSVRREELMKATKIRSGGMIFWNVLSGTNVSEEPAAYLAGQNNV
jgi:hypothetical protein